MRSFVEELIERLERELATLEARVALDRQAGRKQIQGYLDIMKLWAFSSRPLGEPWSGKVTERTRELEQSLRDGCPAEEVHVHVMELLIDMSQYLYSFQDRAARGTPPAAAEKPLGAPPDLQPLQADRRR